MARVLKKPGVVAAPEPIVEEPAPLAGTRRRLKEHPAVAQFSDPEAKARVRERLAANPNLLPTAFSHRPGREGCELTAIESERVMKGQSIKITGFGYSLDNCDGESMCLSCYLEKGRPSQVPGKGFTIALFESKSREKRCVFCRSTFKGER